MEHVATGWGLTSPHGPLPQHPSSGDANSCTQLAQFSSSGERGQSQPSISSITSSLHKGSQAGFCKQSSWIQAEQQPGFHLWFCCFCLWWEREQGNSLARHFIGTGVRFSIEFRLYEARLGRSCWATSFCYFCCFPLDWG